RETLYKCRVSVVQKPLTCNTVNSETLREPPALTESWSSEYFSLTTWRMFQAESLLGVRTWSQALFPTQD
ncbi:hypothetical protein LEMLEM_LOCUS11694, partial [Lemmus lemmus]